MKPLSDILQRTAILLVCCTVGVITAQGRPWTTANGQTIEAEYISATADSVTIRQANGQAFRLKLAECSEDDRAFVAAKHAEQIEANMIEAVVSGEIIWRLPDWSSLGWTNKQDSEIWMCDEKTGTPTEKVGSFSVDYHSITAGFAGRYKTEAPIRLLKTGKFAIKGIFRARVNNEYKKAEQFSAPFSLPSIKNGEIDLHTVRFSDLKFQRSTTE